MRTSKQPKAIAKTIGCNLQSDCQTQLLKTTATQLIEHEEVNLVSREYFTCMCRHL